MSSASSAAGPDLSQEELRDEFEDSGGKTDAIIVAGSKANITFEKEEYVDKILEFVTGKEEAGERVFPPNTWLRYRDNDQGRYRIKLPVPRPPQLGEHAARFGEDERWELHEVFLAAERSPGAEEGAELGLDDFKKLIQKLVKESGGKKVDDKALVKIFEDADEDGSGNVDYYEFLELYGQVKEGKVKALGGSGLFGGMMKKKQPTEDEKAALELTDAQRQRAKKLFNSRSKDSGGEINKEHFKALIRKLVEEMIKKAKAAGDKPMPMPKDKDLDEAFTRADADGSGMVDEEEFLVLYQDVKAGKVKGLGGGMFSSLFTKKKDDKKAAAEEKDEPSLRLTDAERERAKKLFKGRAKDSNNEIDKEKFKALIHKLMEENTKKTVAAGDKPMPMPKEKDLDAAFIRADADGSGMVDEEEFLVLYEDVKAGKVKGLGGGMFSMLGSGMKGLIKKKDPRTNLAITVVFLADAANNKYAGNSAAAKSFDTKVRKVFLGQLKASLKAPEGAEATIIGGVTLSSEAEGGGKGAAEEPSGDATVLVHVSGLGDLEAIEAMAAEVLKMGKDGSSMELLGKAGPAMFGDFRVSRAEPVEPISGFVEDPSLTHGVLTTQDIRRLQKEYRKVGRPTTERRKSFLVLRINPSFYIACCTSCLHRTLGAYAHARTYARTHARTTTRSQSGGDGGN